MRGFAGTLQVDSDAGYHLVGLVASYHIDPTDTRSRFERFTRIELDAYLIARGVLDFTLRVCWIVCFLMLTRALGMYGCNIVPEPQDRLDPD